MSAPFYRAFEDRHRGSRELIKQRQELYLPFIQPLRKLYESCIAVDVGCGRGEWLEVLIENGFVACGVDQDPGMLDACKTLALPAEHGDAIEFLKAQPDQSLAVVSGFHVAEHIPFDALQVLVEQAFRALRPAGILILETPNAENLVVGSNNFYLDPTHERPLPHLLLSFLTEHTGFHRSNLLRLNEPFQPVGGDAVSLMDVLGSVSPDYAIVAQKQACAEVLELFSAPFAQHHGVALDQLASLYDQYVAARFVQADERSGQLHAEIQAIKTQSVEAAELTVRLQASVENLDQRATLVESVAAQLRIDADSREYMKAELVEARIEVMNLNKLLLEKEHLLHLSEQQYQQAHHQLQASLGNAHHWWLRAEETRLRMEGLYRSTSWKLTAPLRLLITLVRGGVRSPVALARRMKHALVGQQPPRMVRPDYPQLYVDVSELVQRDAKTGIQRVVRSILAELIHNPPGDYHIIPVCGMPDGLGYQSVEVSQSGSGLLFTKPDQSPISYHDGDMFLGLDLQHQVVMSHANEYEKMRRAGVKVYFVIYDLLPIFMPDSFWQGASHMHADWLRVIAQSDGAICISRAVADEYHTWLEQHHLMPRGNFDIGWFHLGADLKSSVPTSGLPDNAKQVLEIVSERPTFLVVGTVEPRKGHSQVLAAFNELWAQGIDVNLVIVGKQGWNVEGLAEAVVNHPELNRRLIWADSASDEYLETLYQSCSCLLAASLGEGFGLPLIEAAQHEIPIIARDLPVFQEVAGKHAHYFSGFAATDLSHAIVQWIELFSNGDHPHSVGMPWLTWEQSALQLKDTLFKGQWYWTTSKSENSSTVPAKTQ
jgi:glycosyltransferase involved in cell wall biosynthesis/SAM-dependent methyltransferase